MFSRVAIASVIAQPNVVAFASKDEGGGLVGVVHDPAVCGVEKAMLEEHCRGADWRFVVADSEHFEDIAVLSFDVIFFIDIPSICNDLLETQPKCFIDQMIFINRM